MWTLTSSLVTKHPLGDESADCCASAFESLLASCRFSFWVSGSVQLPLSTDSTITNDTIIIFSTSSLVLARERLLLCHDNDHNYAHICNIADSDVMFVVKTDKKMSNKSRKGFSYARLSTGFLISKSGRRWNKFAIPIAVISIVIGLLAVVAVVLSLTLTPRRAPEHGAYSCQLSSSQRFDCLPGLSGSSWEACSALGCCWDELTSPSCYHSSDSGFAVEQEFQHTELGISGCLAPKQVQSSSFGQNLHRLCVNISFETEQRLHIKVSQHAC